MEELTIGRLTPSICNTMSICSEMAYLSYALKIAQPKSMGAVIGTQVHWAIEEALKRRVLGETVDIVGIQLNARKKTLEQVEKEDVKIKDIYMPFEECLKQLDYCIEGYLKSPEFLSLQPQGEFEEIEHFFKFFVKPIDGKLDLITVPKPGYLSLTGKTDFLEWNEDQKALRIIDYKTGSARFPWEMSKVRKRIQFRVYAWILSKAFEVDEVDMVAHIINKSAGKTAKPVAVQEFATTFDSKDLADCERQMIGFYTMVTQNIHFYCDNCPGYCAYKDLCGKHITPKDPSIDDMDWVL